MAHLRRLIFTRGIRWADKVKVIGALVSLEDGGLVFSVSLDGWNDPLSQPLRQYYKGSIGFLLNQWLEALPNAYEWEGLGKFCEPPWPIAEPGPQFHFYRADYFAVFTLRVRTAF